MNGTDRGSHARAPRVSYRRGDILALGIGALLTVYALAWFAHRTVQGLSRDRAVVPAAPGMHTDVASTDMAGMSHGSSMATDANREFLQAMSDHHEGLVQMATAAMSRASVAETQGDAHMLHEKHAIMRDSMLALIQRDYHETHQVKSMPNHQARADSLGALTGSDYDRAFYRLAIQHHREGLALADRHLPALTKLETRRIAETMRAEQQREITAFESRLQEL